MKTYDFASNALDAAILAKFSHLLIEATDDALVSVCASLRKQGGFFIFPYSSERPRSHRTTRILRCRRRQRSSGIGGRFPESGVRGGGLTVSFKRFGLWSFKCFELWNCFIRLSSPSNQLFFLQGKPFSLQRNVVRNLNLGQRRNPSKRLLRSDGEHSGPRSQKSFQGRIESAHCGK